MAYEQMSPAGDKPPHVIMLDPGLVSQMMADSEQRHACERERLLAEIARLRNTPHSFRCKHCKRLNKIERAA